MLNVDCIGKLSMTAIDRYLRVNKMNELLFPEIRITELPKQVLYVLPIKLISDQHLMTRPYNHITFSYNIIWNIDFI